MKLMLVWPSAEFSTYDCAVGIRAGLVAEGHQVVDYRLYRRLSLASELLTRRMPDGYDVVDLETVSRYGSEPLPYCAIVSRCRWVLIVSGMGLHLNAVWALRQIGARVALWLTEGPYDTTEDRELGLAALADVVFVNERTAVQTVQIALDHAGNGGQAHYLRHAYNPAVHKPGNPATEIAHDVLFIGTGFAERQRILEAVDWHDIDLALGGLWTGIKAPSHLHSHLRYPCLDNADTVRLYHSARIIINPHRWAGGAESANPRVWEVAACGAFQISDYRAEIAEALGDAVPTYQPGVPWQLAALVRRYLRDEPERRRLAALAAERVQAETMQARARQIVQAIADWERQHARPRAVAV